jgi:hypothetical protein
MGHHLVDSTTHPPHAWEISMVPGPTQADLSTAQTPWRGPAKSVKRSSETKGTKNSQFEWERQRKIEVS